MIIVQLIDCYALWLEAGYKSQLKLVATNLVYSTQPLHHELDTKVVWGLFFYFYQLIIHFELRSTECTLSKYRYQPVPRLLTIPEIIIVR